MPGIAGIISQRPAADCERLVSAMVGCLSQESPASSGAISAPELGVYGGWTVSQHSFAAAQVFRNERRDVSLIITGECFAERAVRSELVRKGHHLQLDGRDWLVHLYEERGDEFFHELNGLFSGLLIDERRGGAFLFNDRYGMERLYVHEAKHGLYFASEAKALLRVLPELRSFDPQGVADLLTFGCTTEWRTLFHDVRVLPGGSVWRCEHGTWRKGRYFDPAQWENQEPLDSDGFEATFAETFKRILPLYCESPLPIAIALTGGLDTRMVMACRPDTTQAPVCYTFAGPERDTIDVTLAAKIAKVCGLEHSVVRIGPDFLADFGSHADRTVYVTDGSFGVTGSHEIYLNAIARAIAPVRLTGVFGGEILRGVSTIKRLGLSRELVDASFPLFSAGAPGCALNAADHPVTSTAFKQVPWSLFGSLAACRSQVIFRTPYLDNEIVGLAFRARQKTPQSTEAALRLISENNPLLGALPTDRGWAPPSGKLKGAVRRMTSEAWFKLDYLCNDGLPHRLSRFDAALDRIPRHGLVFGYHRFLQYRRWFRQELAEYLTDSLAAARRMPLWNRRFLNHLAASHIHGRHNFIQEINAVLTLEAVDRLLIHGSQVEHRANTPVYRAHESSDC